MREVWPTRTGKAGRGKSAQLLRPVLDSGGASRMYKEDRKAWDRPSFKGKGKNPMKLCTKLRMLGVLEDLN